MFVFRLSFRIFGVQRHTVLLLALFALAGTIAGRAVRYSSEQPKTTHFDSIKRHINFYYGFVSVVGGPQVTTEKKQNKASAIRAIWLYTHKRIMCVMAR